jgi:hypothetical protein
MFHLRLPLDAIPYWADRYRPSAEEDAIERDLAPAARARGYLTHAELVRLGRWNSPRVAPRLAANAPDYVEAVTAAALAAPPRGPAHERLRIETLMLLSGVAWPTASVLLHWCGRDPYPVLDYHALWSLGVLPHRYDFPLWWAYTLHCRELAGEAGVSMRDLDRALWQYSKENQ